MRHFINGHEEIITITTFCEYRDVMKKVIGVIKDAHNVERKRRQTARKRTLMMRMSESSKQRR